MRVVALISGGKDSCFNMMHCIANGHDIVALANLKPAEKDELDSYMYQTVGHDVIAFYAEALGLPLFRRTIVGSSVCTTSDYTKDERDEVEDLYELLKEVKDNIDFNAVSSGAILSNYQRVRVENVCRRLGLQSLAYLWQRKQEELLEEMLQANLEAILIKVASLGLNPKAHLGKTLNELAPHLRKMNEKYDLNVCGEGGEYETLTLDCPLFLKKIVVDEKVVVIHSDDAFAPVGYLTFKKVHLEDKGIDASVTLSQRMCNCNLAIPNLLKTKTVEYCNKNNISNENLYQNNISKKLNEYTLTSPRIYTSNGRAWVTEIMCVQDGGTSLEEATFETMESLKLLLLTNHYALGDISLVHLFCSSMENFSKINNVYKKFFVINPPARVCIEITLPERMLFKMDVCVDKSIHTRESLHVESISYWAPANIGPYSQVVKVGNHAYFSGSIGMDPSSLVVVSGGLEREATLSLHNVDEVSKVFIRNAKSSKHGLVTCYIVDQSKTDYISELFDIQEMFDSTNYLLNVITIPYLPKGALVEWHVLSRWSEEIISEDVSICDGDDCFKFNKNFFKLLITLTDFESRDNLDDLFDHYLNQHKSVLVNSEFMRVYYLPNYLHNYTENDLMHSFNTCLERAVEKLPATSFVPVCGLERGAVVVVTGSTCDNL